MSAFGGKADTPLLHCVCLLLTQSGHRRGLSQRRFEPVRCQPRGHNETARVHQRAWGLSNRRADFCVCTAKSSTEAYRPNGQLTAAAGAAISREVTEARLDRG